MLQKFLFIGTGGSGGATLRYLYREIDSRLRASGWHEGVPDGFQFLHIDLPSDAGGVPAPDVPASVTEKLSYLALGLFPHEFPHYDQRLTNRAPASQRLYAEFRPNPALEYPKPYLGAGQIRLVGRIVSLAGLDRIKEATTTTAARMTTAKAQEQFQRLVTHLRSDGIVSNPPVRPVLFSSLGGGSGSGIFLDVIEVLRANATGPNSWMSDVAAVLYGPDVFAGGDGFGISANSLGAVSELVAAFDHSGGSTPAEIGLADHGAVPIPNCRGPLYSFVVGGSNEAGGLGSPSQVMQATASAMGAIALDGRPNGLLDYFNTIVLENWQAPEYPNSTLIPQRANSQGVMKGLGRAAVSLGRRQFAQYSAERLAREALDTLRFGHRKAATPDERTRPDDQLVQLVAQREVDLSFRADCGFLDTRGRHTTVTEALLPASARQERHRSAVLGMLDRFRSPEESVQLRAEEWQAKYTEGLQEVARGVWAGESELRSATAQRWVQETQQRILDATARAIGRVGLPTTAVMLEKLIQEVNDGAAHSREKAKDAADNLEPQWIDEINHVFSKLRNKVGPDRTEFDDISPMAMESIGARSLSQTHRLAAELMESIATDLLPQLQAAVQTALDVINTSLSAQANLDLRQMVDQWPVRDVSLHLQPGPTEFLIQPWASWPDEFDRLLQEQTGALVAQALPLVTSEVVGGAYPHRDRPDRVVQDCIRQLSEWWPANDSARPPGRRQAQAAFQVDLTVRGLLGRATSWINDRSPGPIQIYVHEQLSEYLDTTHPEAAIRSQNVIAALNVAVPRAQPLVKMNSSAMAKLYPDHDTARAIVQASSIPAPASMQDDVRKIFAAAGSPPDRLQFDPATGGDTIEIVSFHTAPYEPWVFSTVADTIADEYPFNALVSGRFWVDRRARHLGAFVPTSPQHLTALIRGALTASVLGDLVQGQPPATSIGRPTVWSPAGVLTFPAPLLTEPTDQSDVIGALVESMPLAFLLLARGSDEPLAAYERLLELGLSRTYVRGQQVDGRNLAEYPMLNPELASWLRTGERTAPAAGNTAPPGTPRVSAPTEEERREELKTTLESWAEHYETLATQPVAKGAYRLAFHHQTAGMLGTAARALIAAISANGAVGTTPPI